MEPEHTLSADLERLTDLERHIVQRFINRQGVARDIGARPRGFGERLADRVAGFGGSWTFILCAGAAIGAWMFVNATMGRPFDPYPYILLNLVLSCVAALQAPIIMMS